MTPVDLSAHAADPDPRSIVLAKDSPQYAPLPALVFADGKVCTEWALSEEERQRLIAGERIRLWVWPCGQACPPVALQITDGD